MSSGARGLTGCTRSGRRRRDQRHTVEQNVDNSPFLPTLDVPVPQMENQLVDVCRLFDVLIPEQAIEVPKISPTPRPPRRRRVRFAEQTAEQLVEVADDHHPILLCCSELWSRTSTFQFLVVEGENVGLQGFPPKTELVQQRCMSLRNAVLSGLWSRSWILVCLVASFKIFRPVQGSSASSSSSREHAGEGVFRTFPRVQKKPQVGLALGVGTARRVEPIHAERSPNG